MVAPTRVNGGISSGMAVAPGPLADDDVDAEVLHRHVEHLLGGPGHPVDLVEEEHVALVHAREDRGEVAGVLDRRAAGDPQRRGHLGGDDHRERGLAETGRAGEQHVVGHPPAAAGGLEHQPELLAHPVLADELVEGAGPQRRLDGALVALGLRGGRASGGAAVSWASRWSTGSFMSGLAQRAQRRPEQRRRPAGRRRPRARPPRRASSASLADQPRPTSACSTWSFHGPGRLARVPLRTCPDGSAEPVLELEDDALGALLADAGHPGQRLGVVGGDRHAQVVGRQARRGSPAPAWGRPRGGLHELEDHLLVVVEEAEEGQGVLAHDHARGQRRGLADPQRGERARGALSSRPTPPTSSTALSRVMAATGPRTKAIIGTSRWDEAARVGGAQRPRPRCGPARRRARCG